ncbi:MAG: hypothetical protein LBU89_09665 [Fibromonadaceae bacterium]|jgi:hypothetical protein|nr:hypothetical protein [Fibromonadaceae bacterium]
MNKKILALVFASAIFFLGCSADTLVAYNPDPNQEDWKDIVDSGSLPGPGPGPGPGGTSYCSYTNECAKITSSLSASDCPFNITTTCNSSNGNWYCFRTSGNYEGDCDRIGSSYAPSESACTSSGDWIVNYEFCDSQANGIYD